jgi:hypothetical protein
MAMKLRLGNNSIRLRLSQRDLRRFEENGLVEESVTFVTDPSATLHYRLVSDGTAETVTAAFEGNLISIRVPTAAAVEWASTPLVGIEETQSLENGESLRILLEKDFACLEPRDHGEDDDAFPNPDAGQAHCA